jgi:uncharacterized protein YndB with AHSA1/START domain
VRVTRKLDVRHPQEAVFDFLADVRNERLWHPDVEEAELETDGPIGTGSRFRLRYHRLGWVELEVLEFERPWRLVFRASGGTKAVYETRLQARDGGTRIVTVADAKPRGLGRLIWPLLHGRIQKDFQRRGDVLVAGLDQHVPHSPE